MASATPTTTVPETATPTSWQGGVVAGLAGGLVMGALFAIFAPPLLTDAIPALYGLSGGLAGWTIHMANSAILGVVFAAIARALPKYSDTTMKSTGLGAVYGAVLWIALAAVVMPIWLAAVDFPAVPPLPNVDLMGLVFHVAYGLVLGATYPAFSRWLSPKETASPAA
ncbi:histidine kinase [Halegenticoccus tardaugens]|uniref:histidine kinase n=1 Tax=Halegenticoccus tardaugens TaxID=2071624 RepID=UPI00100B0356|nr:histidine kinase [Halegenticoccus tardaugens]